MTPPFRRVLVANRGEIALRIVRACHEMGMEAVAVYSDADATAAHVRAADHAVRLGPAPPAESYLRIDAVVAPPWPVGAEAVHPGYGFLSEREAFAQRVEDAGLAWVGPPPAVIAALGDKLAARRIARDAECPHVPGTLEPAVVDRPDQVAAVAGGGPRGRVPAARQGRGRRRRPRDAARRVGRRARRLRCWPARERRPAPSATGRSTWSARSCRPPRRGPAARRRRRERRGASGSVTARRSGATRS